MNRDLSNPDAVKAQQKSDDLKRRQYLSDLKAVLDTPEGRRVWWSKLGLLYRLSAHQSGSWTYFNEGERNISLQMQADALEASPSKYLLMESEARSNTEVKTDGN